jgi:streptogramin lyase
LRRAGWRLAILALVVASGGCETRDRSNPLDPNNNETGGLIEGFNALAGNRQVEIRWSRVKQNGLVGYRLLRWLPGDTPAVLEDHIASNLTGTVDSAVVNEESYVYQVVAHFQSGDTLASPPDTATPGSRQIIVLGADLPGMYGLTPDGRDILYTQASEDAYEDMELDENRGILWLSIPLAGSVLRLFPSGAVAAPEIQVTYASDVSISDQRGYGWVADPQSDVIRRYGPSLDDVAGLPGPTFARARVVEAGKHTQFVWIGNDGGHVFRRLNTTDSFEDAGEWILPGSVRAIAIDEGKGQAWVVVRPAGETGTDDLYRIDPVDSTVTGVPFRLANVADVEFDEARHSLWVSEEGPPALGSGRLDRLDDQGVIQATRSGIEPFGIHVDKQTGSCWVADLKSKRVLEVAPDGSVELRTTRIETPYLVRVIPGAPVP